MNPDSDTDHKTQDNTTGEDIRDGVDNAIDDTKDMIDDAGNAIDEAIEGRSRHHGTGMPGGR